jgi:hypothetical protein
MYYLLIIIDLSCGGGGTFGSADHEAVVELEAPHAVPVPVQDVLALARLQIPQPNSGIL